jgi:hypothetical protein
MAGRLVTIAAFAEATAANAARNALDAAGIPATLNTEGSFGLFGRTVTALSVRLVVREADEPAAVKVLDDTFGPQEQVSEAELAARAEAAEPEDARDAAGLAAPESDPETDSLARETDARVAFQAAAIGLVFPIATLFALVAIVQASCGPGELSARGRWRLRAAVALALGPLVLVELVLAAMILWNVL